MVSRVAALMRLGLTTYNDPQLYPSEPPIVRLSCEATTFFRMATMIKRSALTFIFSTAMILGVGSAAGAQDGCPASPQPCDVEVKAAGPKADPPAAPVVVAAAPLPRQTLPVTGSETAAIALGGTLLVAAGGALVLRSNKAAA